MRAEFVLLSKAYIISLIIDPEDIFLETLNHLRDITKLDQTGICPEKEQLYKLKPIFMCMGLHILSNKHSLDCFLAS